MKIKAVANEFLSLSVMNVLRLQKLIYLAHGFNLAFFNEPLVDEEPIRAKYGIRFQTIHDEFLVYGDKDITATAIELTDNGKGIYSPTLTDKNAKVLIRHIYDLYKSLSTLQICSYLHTDKFPWFHIKYNNVRIPDEMTKQYFKRLIEK